MGVYMLWRGIVVKLHAHYSMLLMKVQAIAIRCIATNDNRVTLSPHIIVAKDVYKRAQQNAISIVHNTLQLIIREFVKVQ
jgi:hypothetical protein